MGAQWTLEEIKVHVILRNHFVHEIEYWACTNPNESILSRKRVRIKDSKAGDCQLPDVQIWRIIVV